MIRGFSLSSVAVLGLAELGPDVVGDLLPVLYILTKKHYMLKWHHFRILKLVEEGHCLVTQNDMP